MAKKHIRGRKSGSRKLREGFTVPHGAVAGGVLSLTTIDPDPSMPLRLGEARKRSRARKIRELLERKRRMPTGRKRSAAAWSKAPAINKHSGKPSSLRPIATRRTSHKSFKAGESRIAGSPFLASSEERGRRAAERRTGHKRSQSLREHFGFSPLSGKGKKVGSAKRKLRSAEMVKRKRKSHKRRRTARELLGERKRRTHKRRSSHSRRKSVREMLGMAAGERKRKRKSHKRRRTAREFGFGLGLAPALTERKRRRSSRKHRSAGRRHSVRRHSVRELFFNQLAERRRKRLSGGKRRRKSSKRRAHEFGSAERKRRRSHSRKRRRSVKRRHSARERRHSMKARARSIKRARRSSRSHGFRELFLSDLGYGAAERKRRRRSHSRRHSARELVPFYAAERKHRRKSSRRRHRRTGGRRRSAREMFSETRYVNPGYMDEVIKPGVAALVGLIGTRFLSDQISKIAGPTLAKASPTIAKATPVITAGVGAWLAWQAGTRITALTPYRGLLAIGAGLAVAEELLALVAPTFGLRPGAGALSNAMFGDGVSGLDGACFTGACPGAPLPDMSAQSCAACAPAGTAPVLNWGAATATAGVNGLGGACFTGACPGAPLPDMSAQSCASCTPSGTSPVLNWGAATAMPMHGLNGCCGCGNQGYAQPAPMMPPGVVPTPGPTGTAGLGLAAQVAISNAKSDDPAVNSILAGLSGKAQDILSSVGIN